MLLCTENLYNANSKLVLEKNLKLRVSRSEWACIFTRRFHGDHFIGTYTLSPPTLTVVAASCGMDDSLEERFRLAAQRMRTNTTIKLSNDQKLEIYAYFKQVRTNVYQKFELDGWRLIYTYQP